jgi:AcrR family transcriptional regulator
MPQGSGLRERKRRATRTAIIDAATTLFLERGMQATTIADITEAAGLARRTFFLHFASKEDVLFHHVEDYSDLALATVAGLEETASAWEAVQAAMLALVDAFDSPETRIDALAELRVLAVREASGLPASLVMRLQRLQARLLAALQRRHPDPAQWPVLAAHLGACIGSAAGAAQACPVEQIPAAMRRAVRLAGAGFR